MTPKVRFLLIPIFLLLLNSVSAQTVNNGGDIDMRFLKDKIEIESGESIFNILLLSNKSNHEISFNIKLNTPKDWLIIGSSYEQISLPPNGSLSFPVRVSVSKNANGGVGYAIVAVLTDNNKSIYDSEYCFVKIPVKSVINVKANKKSRYFNHNTLKSTFSLKVENKGNIDEITNIKITPDKSIKILNGTDNILVEQRLVKTGENKTFKYEVQLNKDIDYKKYRVHKVNLEVSLHDSVISKTVWFKYLDWKYKNIFSELNYPLNIEFSAYNIFGNSTPIYIGKIFGNILFKRKKNIVYSFENYNQDPSTNNLWINSRMKIDFHTPKTNIFLGDYTGNFEHSMYGRGVFISQSIGENIKIKGVATRRLLQKSDNYGLSYSHSFPSLFTFELGGVYSQLPAYKTTANLEYGLIKTRILKQNLMLLIGSSQSTNNQLIKSKSSGWGYRLNFAGNIKSLKFSLRSHFGTSNYWGYSRGRQYTEANVSLPISENKHFRIQYYNQKYQPTYISDSVMHDDKFTSYQQLRPQMIYWVKKNISIYLAPIFEEQTTNTYSTNPDEGYFATFSGKAYLGVRVYNKFSDNSFSLYAKYGFTNVYNYSLVLNSISYEGRTAAETFNVSEFGASFMQKNFGVYLKYNIGPYNLSQQFSYFYSHIDSKSLSIIPYYERDLIDNKVRLILRGSYINNLSSKNSRININTGIKWNIGKGWSFRFTNTSSVQRVSNSSGSGSYTSTYFEAGIRKSFNISQPRLKYHDLKIVYYKDYNGNRIHDPNEPGVTSVLTDIQRANPIEDNKDPNYNGEFLPNELLSNQEGHVEYNNIVEGNYLINYTPQISFDNTYESESTTYKFTASKDTVLHIPFMERNKLFGRVHLNRNKNSALGDIPINNIKIIVEGNDRTYSALTDKDGYFELFVPVSDYYKVKINNIFHEHFSIRQAYYIVKFNGYKNFEVSFDFDEKERKISFDESEFLIDDDDVADDDFSFDDIKIIKQTNLRGITKDANSLMPLHAIVSIYNSKTNELISETASSKRTGVYFTSFFAGDNYYIKTTAKGYWTYKADLNIQQVTTFENLNHDILLNKIFLEEEIKTDNLNFKSESATLSPLAKAELDNIVNLLYLNPSVHIEVLGHADNVEALILNPTGLSEARATVVAAYLIKRGIREHRIKTKGLSNLFPKTTDDSEDGRARNRIAEIIVTAF